MTNRNAVFTTLNGKIVEWNVFDGEGQALAHYNASVNKLRDMVQKTEDGDWEIMMCEVQQYALSKPQRAAGTEQKEADWYARYLAIMSDRAKRVAGLRPRWTKGVWVKLRSGRSICDGEEHRSRVHFTKKRKEESPNNNSL